MVILILADANDALAGKASTEVGLFSHVKLEVGRLVPNWIGLTMVP